MPLTASLLRVFAAGFVAVEVGRDLLDVAFLGLRHPTPLHTAHVYRTLKAEDAAAAAAAGTEIAAAQPDSSGEAANDAQSDDTPGSHLAADAPNTASATPPCVPMKLAV